jgi:uncharacterized protein
LELSRDLLDILACPRCKGEIDLTGAKDALVCERCRVLYPIRDGIPVMLAEEAIPLPQSAVTQDNRQS